MDDADPRQGDHPLRVLAYCDSRQFSGAEAFFVQAVLDLQRQDDVDVIPAAPECNQALRLALEAAAGRPTIGTPSQPHRLSAFHLFDLRLRRRVSDVVRDVDFDVALCNLSSAEHGAILLFTPEARRRVSVGLLHLHHRSTTFGNRMGRTRERLARIGTRRLDGLCVLSPAAASLASDRWAGPGCDIRVVPMPRPTIVSSPPAQARERLKLPANGRIAGFVGRLNFRQKGLDTFVETAALIAGEMPDVTFVVAGEGNDGPAARTRVTSLGLSDRFMFLGRVEDMGSLLSALDIVIIPSRIEGVPLISLEAVLLGVPGAACAVDGLIDVWPPEWQAAPDSSAELASIATAILMGDRSASSRIMAEARAKVETTILGDLGPPLRAALRAAVARSGGPPMA